MAIADKVSVPTYTLDAAHLLLALVDRPEITGVIHLSNTGACTWQEYGQHALDCAIAAGWPLRTPRRSSAIQLADMKAFVARRPVYTPLAAEQFARLTGIHPRSWQEAVDVCAQGERRFSPPLSASEGDVGLRSSGRDPNLWK